MNIFNMFKKIIYGRKRSVNDFVPYEYCTRCDANLTLQKGYSSDFPYWVCKGCGEMLINPNVETENDIVWRCDKCESMLNIQPGFSEDCGSWKCAECGFINRISADEVFLSCDEYYAYCNSPLKGLADEDILKLHEYREISPLNGRDDITVMEGTEEGKKYIRKILNIYDVDVYRYLMDNPIPNMPRLYAVCEGDNNLVIIEEYIEGKTLSEILEDGGMDSAEAVQIAKSICYIIKNLHALSKPIIHRDIKPSNIIISESGEAYLIDINVAKWYKPGEIEDTKLLGSLYYAAPEQFGYGYTASSEKSDIYALGILLNVMITGKFPKEKKADGEVWNLIEKCISFNPDDRYTDSELIEAFDNIAR